jgi:hypothetical protein
LFQDQESWGRGSSGHKKGDVLVRGFTKNLDERFFCRRVHLKCNGVDTCEYIDRELFAGCERFEPDLDAMRALWNHELEANEAEAASVSGILAQYVSLFMNFLCI